MHRRTLATIGALACALTATACTTDRNGEARDTTTVKDAVKRRRRPDGVRGRPYR